MELFLESKKPCIVVAGPTASGKTALGVELCKIFNGEVISADSMQIYKGMDILTAKPTPEEMQGVPHHMVGFADPSEPYSVADYVKKARKCITDIWSRGKTAVIVGGTGLYIDSLMNGVSFEDEKQDTKFREELTRIARDEGSAKLYSRLQEIDPEAAKSIHPNNLIRVIRALEVYHITGKTFSEVKFENIKNADRIKAVWFALTASDRQYLYQRCDKRCDKMLEAGLLDEVREILKSGSFANSANAIGLKEWIPYFNNLSTKEECLEQMKLNTRHYAKRQLTWFRRNDKFLWVMVDKYSQSAKISEYCKKIVAKQELL